MCTLNEPAALSSPAQALAMVSAGLGLLAACDAAGLGTAGQAEALIGLEQAEAQHTAARASILSAFTAEDGFQADGQFGAKSWLRAVTKVTRGAAAGATGWARRRGGRGDSGSIRCSPARWRPRSSARRGRGRSATGPTSCRRTIAGTRIRFCWRRLWAARACPTSARWPRR